jgi:nitrogen fixation NifU-like protein
MVYSDNLRDHFENPRNAGSLDDNDPQVGTAIVGASAFGTVIRLQIKVNAQGLITEIRFKTHGCGAAIASSSLLTEWAKDKTLEEAEAIEHDRLARYLALPPNKLYCSVLAVAALRAAIRNYRARQQMDVPHNLRS